ncbi:MAG: hypothetical protein U1E76_16225 [Planctomycetota bacterium]
MSRARASRQRVLRAALAGLLTWPCAWSRADDVAATAAADHTVTMELKDAPLEAVLRTLARKEKLNLVLAPGLHGQVTLHVENAPWREVLDSVLKMHGLSVRSEGGVLEVFELPREVAAAPAPAAPPAPTSITRVFELHVRAPRWWPRPWPRCWIPRRSRRQRTAA